MIRSWMRLNRVAKAVVRRGGSAGFAVIDTLERRALLTVATGTFPAPGAPEMAVLEVHAEPGVALETIHDAEDILDDYDVSAQNGLELDADDADAIVRYGTSFLDIHPDAGPSAGVGNALQSGSP